MIVAVVQTKGGVGKTTLTVNLVVERVIRGKRDVLLVDADEQGTASDFTALRLQDAIGEEPGEPARERRLAAPVGRQHRVAFAGRELGRQRVEHGPWHPRIAEGEVIDLD